VGGVTLISKPFEISALAGIVHQILGERSAPGG
jgi:hypothetical protein